MRMERATNGYIVREHFYSDETWRAYLRKAMARRQDYRPLDVVIEETVASAAGSAYRAKDS